MTKYTKPITNTSKPNSEEDRLVALQSYHILDTLPEAAFDRITQAASAFCGTEVALISLTDESRQWFKSSVGLALSEVPRDISFCTHAILHPDELMEVEDTTLDPRFSDNPLVTACPKVRFYAGMPLTTPQGHALGALCVVGSKPGKLNDGQREGLKQLSATVMALFDERLSSSLTPLGRAIEETLNIGITVTDAGKSDNLISYCNLGFEKLSGYSRHEIIGNDCRFLQGADTAPLELDRLRQAIAYQQECDVTLKNYRKDGTAFWNELTVSPVRNNEGRVTHFFGIQQDITAQREAEERELGLLTVLEDSLNEIFIFDAETLKFIQVNKGARQNLGYGMNELLDMTPLDIKPDHTEKSFQSTIKPLIIDEKQKIVFNTSHRRKDGSQYLAEVHLQKMQFQGQSVFVAITLDITERTQNKLDLVQAHAFLDSAPDATVVVDQSGIVRISNRQMVELLGYTQEELMGMNVDTLVPNLYRDSHAKHLASFAADSKVRDMEVGLDLSAISKGGLKIPIEVSFGPIETSDGTLVAAAIRDISVRKAFEVELRIAKQIAECATMEKSQFLAAASHDLRQPLQALRLYLSALIRKLDQPEQVRRLSEKMDSSLESMGDLLAALLDISMLESGSIEPDKHEVSLLDFLNDVKSRNSQQIREKGLNFVCSPKACVVHTDPALLERIIENFITNAIRYTETGTISIDCQLHDGYVCVAVSDTGKGIPAHELKSIFNNFYQLDNTLRSRVKGLGLGLSIVKNLARILDHQTHVTSTPGKGSTFSVDVPLSQSQAVFEVHKVQHKEGLTNSSLTETLTVLIVDDEPDIVDAMQELLGMFDMKIVTAGHGAEALAHIQEGVKPDFMLTDYGMPDINGIELIIKLRAAVNQDFPVVIMTGATSTKIIEDANLVNCTILQKPINIEQLLSLIKPIKS